MQPQSIPALSERPGRSGPSGRSVLVAVLTYRRPDDLAAVLPMVLNEAAAVTDGSVVEVMVVDNDPDAGAAPMSGAFEGVRHVHEPRPGIAAGRNRALAEGAEHDVLVFIDDDERPTTGWLALLLAAFDRYGAAAVVGPVVSDFAVPLDEWVSAGGFFTRRRMPTGSPVTVAATNNLLLDMATVRTAGLQFDERLGLAGGSDTLFSRQLVAAAGPLVWCDEAVVTDVVPAARSTRDWVLRRQLRSGNSWSRTTLMLTSSPLGRVRLRVRLTVKALVRLVGGPAGWLFGVLTGSIERRARGAKATARGLGLLMGAFGLDYAEYKRPAPDPAAVAR